MGKSRLAKKQRAANFLENSEAEGLFKCSFTFGGERYEYQHQLTRAEVVHMQELCKTHGDEAASQVVWRAAIRGIGMVAENILAKAALDYIKKNHVVVALAEPDTPDDVAEDDRENADKLAAYLAEKKAEEETK